MRLSMNLALVFASAITVAFAELPNYHGQAANHPQPPPTGAYHPQPPVAPFSENTYNPPVNAPQYPPPPQYASQYPPPNQHYYSYPAHPSPHPHPSVPESPSSPNWQSIIIFILTCTAILTFTIFQKRSPTAASSSMRRPSPSPSPNEEPNPNPNPSQGDPSFNPRLFNSPSQELNILLLGETGTGKSTTINALANYLLHSKFQDAATQQFKQLIPAKFSLSHPDTHQMCDITLGGEDVNEAHAVAGSSVTQEPRTYSFAYGRTLIRIIDTPGMGDTRGSAQDKANFEKILAHLRLYRELHGICILLKATETRTGASFRYCVNELLTHLHKDAVKNMVFLFTFSRSTLYGPGDGFTTLQSFLSKELKEAAIPMRPNGPDANCFFIDNEAFRFLVAKKWGYPFTARQEASFCESWNCSVEETVKMFDRITSQRAHLLESTLNLNHARKIILQLAEPLARLQSKNSGNIKIIQEKQASLQDTNKTVSELAKLLYLEVDDLEAQALEQPNTVCTAKRCTSLLKVNGIEKVNYWQKCHQPCGLTHVEAKIIGHSALTQCLSMDKETGICTKCGCSWRVHMHSEFDYETVKRRIIDTNRQTEIRTKEDAIRETKRFMAQCQQAMEEFKEEMEVIHDVSAFFACILINYSNSPYNRFLEPHLNLLIDEEEKKINASGGKYSSEVKCKLQEMLSTHRANVETMQKAIANQERENVRLADIDSHLDRLTSLKHTGPDLRQILGTFDKAQIRKMASTLGGHSNAARTVPMGGEPRRWARKSKPNITFWEAPFQYISSKIWG